MTDVRDQVRDLLAQPVPGIDTQPPLDGASSDDEIIAALHRQVAALEATGTALLAMAQSMLVSVGNIKAELDLFDMAPTPLPETVAPKVEVARTMSGAVVEATLPEDKRLPAFCNHPDALLVNTAEGQVRVCPDCPDD